MLRKNNGSAKPVAKPKGIRLKAQAQRKPPVQKSANTPKPHSAPSVGQTLGKRPHTVLQKATKPTGQSLPGAQPRKGNLKSAPKPASKEQHRVIKRQVVETTRTVSNAVSTIIPVARAKVISNLIYQHFGAQQVIAGAEVGIWKAETSAFLLETHANLNMACIDPWCVDSTYKDGPGSKIRSQSEWDLIYTKAIQKLGVYGNRVTVIKKRSDGAAQHIQDKSLDFVFIDANHSDDNVKLDIMTWLPKIKSGGYLIGHDFNLESVQSTALNLLKRVEGGKEDIDYVWWFQVQ